MAALETSRRAASGGLGLGARCGPVGLVLGSVIGLAAWLLGPAGIAPCKPQAMADTTSACGVVAALLAQAAQSGGHASRD